MRVRAASFWDYCEGLLALAGRPVPSSELAGLRTALQEEGVGKATTYEWSSLFKHHRVITGSDLQRVDARRLIEVCTWLRGAELGFPRTFSTADGPPELSEALYEAGIPHAFGAVTAANQWSFYESASTIQLYVPPKALAATRDRLAGSKRGARLEIYGQAPAKLPIAGRDLWHHARRCQEAYGPAYREKDLGRRSGARIPVTTRFVSLLDCRVHPEGASHAAFLQDQIVSRARG